MTTHSHEQTEACPICGKHQGEVPGGVIYEDELIYVNHVFNKTEPTFLGYVRLETKRHVPSYAELTPEEARTIGTFTSRLSRALKACTGGDHVYVFFYGDHVAHLHLHIWARYPGTPEEFWRDRVDEWSGSPKGGLDEVAALNKRLSAFLKENPA